MRQHVSNLFERMKCADQTTTIKIPFDPGLPPRVQIEAAVASLPPQPCKRHPHELRPLDKHLTVENALTRDHYCQYRWGVDFIASYDRCASCPHNSADNDIEVEGCPAVSGKVGWGSSDRNVRDEQCRPLPKRYARQDLDADRSVREQFEKWLAGNTEIHCEFSNQPLRRCDARIEPPFETWTIEPQFACCLQCSLERLGISPDEAHASFENFIVDPPVLATHLEQCRVFAAAPNGILVLLGNCGTGKTHLAIATMRERLRLGGYGLRFVKHRHFLAEHGRALRPVPFDQESPESPLSSCQEAELLIYDELTAATDSRSHEDLLLDLFEARIGHFRPTIITANLSPGELEAALGSRLFDRLRRAAFAVLEFGFDSKRKPLNADYLNRARPNEHERIPGWRPD